MSAGEGPPAWRVEEHEALPSTQDLVKERLAEGEAVDGLVVRALSQPAGRGRRGRSWESPPGGSYQSFAVRDRWEGALRQGGLTLLIGVELAEALRDAGAQASVKWPNDLYLAGGKLGGVLSEYLRGHLIVGIGLNVANEPPEGAAGLRGWALAYVNELVQDAVSGAVGGAVGESGLAALPQRLAPLDLLAGRVVSVKAGSSVHEGVAEGVDGDGALLLRVGGTVERVLEGTILEWGPHS